jgi:ribonuclease HII
MSVMPRGLTVRRDAGLYGYERALRRVGLEPIAGVDAAPAPVRW